MDKSSKILLWCVVILTFLSVSATFYKTVVLQDFEMTGIYIEFPTEDSSYVWFIYNNTEYELELETADYDAILLAVSEAVSVPADKLDLDFIDYLLYAYDEAELVEEENETTEELLEGIEETESEEMINEESNPSEATSAEDFSNAELVEPVSET